MIIPLGTSSTARRLTRTPELLIINMVMEKDPANSVDGLVRFGRPGLQEFSAIASDGPTRGMFRQAGTFGGDYLAVAGSSLHRVTPLGAATLLGTIAGDGRVSFAANETRALIATGLDCHSTNGTSVTTIAMPGGELVSSVAYINGYFILTVTGTDTVFFIPPGGTDPDPLDFFSIESSPDPVLIVKKLFDELHFFGVDTTETWQPTGDADAPFRVIPGRTYERGTANADTVVATDNALFAVGDDGVVHRFAAQPVRVSDHSVEEAIRVNGTADLSAWAFALDGHKYYVLRIGGTATYVHDIENPNWYHWKTYARSVWQAHCGAQIGNQVIAGDDEGGTLWLLDPARANDHGLALIREVRGATPWAGPKPLPAAVVSIFAQTGWAGLNEEPMIELNFSDDGVTFHSMWYQISLGRQGQYGTLVQQRQLGIIEAPGRLWALRMSHDSPFRVSYAKLNEA